MKKPNNYDERELLPLLLPATGHPPRMVKCPITTEDHHVGQKLSTLLAKKYADGELPPEKMLVHFVGSAGDYFGDGLVLGITFVVDSVGSHGCANMHGGVVVILSEPGANFCEKISCGCIYLYDLRNKLLQQQKNAQFSAEHLLSTSAETQLLKSLVAQHAELTGSSKAKKILSDWEAALPFFVRVTASL